jgi:hypothetical protein
MVKTLATVPTGDVRSADSIEGFKVAVKADFESNLYNDLAVGPAIDALEDHISALYRYHTEGQLNENDRTWLAEMLKDIDSVLQVLFA